MVRRRSVSGDATSGYQSAKRYPSHSRCGLGTLTLFEVFDDLHFGRRDGEGRRVETFGDDVLRFKAAKRSSLELGEESHDLTWL